MLLFRILANLEDHFLIMPYTSGASPPESDDTGSGGGEKTDTGGVLNTVPALQPASKSVDGAGAGATTPPSQVSKVSRFLAQAAQQQGPQQQRLHGPGIQHTLHNLNAHCAFVAPLVESAMLRPRINWVCCVGWAYVVGFLCVHCLFTSTHAAVLIEVH